MNELLLPHQPAAACIEREQRIGEAIGAEALTAVVIGAGGGRGHQHQTMLLIDRHHAPGVCGAAALSLLELPVGRRRMRRRIGQRIEGPELRPALNVVSTDDSALDLCRTVVAYGGSDYHDLADDRRWGSDQVLSGFEDAQAASEVHLT